MQPSEVPKQSTPNDIATCTVETCILTNQREPDRPHCLWIQGQIVAANPSPEYIQMIRKQYANCPRLRKTIN